MFGLTMLNSLKYTHTQNLQALYFHLLNRNLSGFLSFMNLYKEINASHKGSSHLDRLRQDNPRDKSKELIAPPGDAGREKRMDRDKQTPQNDLLCLLRVGGGL